MREIESVKHGATVRVVVGRALTAHVRRPHRHLARVRRRIARRDKAIDPAEEQPTGIARSPDLALARCGVRNCPQPGHLAPLGDGRPDDQRGSTQHQHVAVLVGTGDHLFADGVDGACGQHGLAVAHLADGGTGCFHARHAVDRRAAVGTFTCVPPGAVEQRQGGERGGEVDHGLARHGVVGHRGRGPVARRVGCFVRRPSQELCRLAHHEAHAVRWGRNPAAAVAVQQARGDGNAVGVDRRQGRDHRRDGHRAGVGAPQPLESLQRTVPPGLLGVMLESVRCGYLQPVRNARPRRYLAVLVGGHRFDRGRADVDADCHLFA